MTVLVDSDIVIEVCRGRDTEILERWAALGQSDSIILYSPVTAAELWTGVHEREKVALSNLFRTLFCATIDYETGRLAGDYLRQYRKSHAVEMSDALIGAAATINRAHLWTRNRKHYPMKELAFY